MDYFRRLITSSKKYGQYHLNNGKFGEMKWRNITVQEMLNFYGIMLCLSFEPYHIGGYTSYFESI